MGRKRNSKKEHTTINDLARLLNILTSPDNGLTQRKIAERLHLSTATITRLLRTARTEYQMLILRPIGRDQPYRIESWGLLSQSAIAALTSVKTPRKAKSR